MSCVAFPWLQGAGSPGESLGSTAVLPECCEVSGPVREPAHALSC